MKKYNQGLQKESMYVCMYDMYFAYTEKSLIVSECDNTTKYYYEIDEVNDAGLAEAKRLENTIPHKSIGKVFPLDSISELQIKKGMFGCLKCVLKLDNGTYFKFLIPKRVGGITSQMPEHMKNRDKLIEVIKRYSQVGIN